MSRAKPLVVNGLHYPSRTSAIRALYAQGMTPREIAECTGLTKMAINNALYSGPNLRRSLTVPHRVVTALEPSAARRGMSATVLASRLLGVVANEPGLVDAILDDAEDERAAA